MKKQIYMALVGLVMTVLLLIAFYILSKQSQERRKIESCLQSYFYLHNLNNLDDGSWNLEKPGKVKYMRTLDDNAYLVTCETFDEPRELEVSKDLAILNGSFIAEIIFDGDDYLIQQRFPVWGNILPWKTLAFANEFGLRENKVNCSDKLIEKFLDATSKSMVFTKKGNSSCVFRYIDAFNLTPPGAKKAKGGAIRNMEVMPMDLIPDLDLILQWNRIKSGLILAFPCPECSVDCSGLVLSNPPFPLGPYFRHWNTASWHKKRSCAVFPIENKTWQYEKIIIDGGIVDYLIKMISYPLFFQEEDYYDSLECKFIYWCLALRAYP